MIEYLQMIFYIVLGLIGTIILGLSLFYIIDIVIFIANKLGNLIFRKEK